MKHGRTLQLEEDVLCVKLSPDHRLLAVSLLDCTVKVFYTDTLKVTTRPAGRIRVIRFTCDLNSRLRSSSSCPCTDTSCPSSVWTSVT